MARILFADDDDAGRLMMAEALEGLGHEVVAFNNPTDALKAFPGAPPFDLVLTDYNMGVKDTGVDLARGIRKINLHIPIILYTDTPLNDIKDAEKATDDQLGYDDLNILPLAKNGMKLNIVDELIKSQVRRYRSSGMTTDKSTT